MIYYDIYDIYSSAKILQIVSIESTIQKKCTVPSQIFHSKTSKTLESLVLIVNPLTQYHTCYTNTTYSPLFKVYLFFNSSIEIIIITVKGVNSG